jgi:dCMP deaminase
MNRQYLKRRVFMGVAVRIGALSTCPRKAVGAVIIRDGRCISWGFNGAPPGAPHCDHALDEPCDVATHAEANALAFAAREGISTDNSTLFVTVSPCAVCSRLLIAAGVEQVFYLEPYRDTEGIDILLRADIGVNQCDA